MTQVVRKQWFWLVLLSITLVAFAMRLLWLDRPSFWIDELYTVMHTCRLDQGNLTKRLGYVPTWIALVLADALPSASDALHPERWSEIGVTHFHVRIPSVVIGTLSVFLLGWLSRGIVGARTAIWFAAFLAVSVWHLHMSQTGRFYAQQLLFYNLGFLLYFRATSIGSIPRLVLSMVMLWLGFMSQPPALMLGVIIGIDWAMGLLTKSRSRLTWPAFFIGGVAAAACASVLAIDITIRTDEWAQFAGQISQPWHKILLGVVWLVGPVTALLAFVGWLRLLQTDQRLATYLGLGAVLPVLIMATMGATGQFVHVRYTFVALPAWLLLAAVGATSRQQADTDPILALQREIPGLLVIVAGLLQCFGYYTGGGGYRPAWRDAIEYIAAHRQPGDIITGDEHAYWQTRYYLGDTSFDDRRIEQGPPMDLRRYLNESQQRVWIIDKGGTGGAMRYPWLRHEGDLRWYFDRQLLQPFSTVKVFVHEPLNRTR